MVKEKKKGNRQNYVSRTKSTKASPSVATANVVINVDNARQKLQELKSVYQQKVDFADTRGFLTDLRTALGIPNDRGASKYGVVKGGDFIASISLTNHNSNAQTYVDANANYPYNLRLMIRRRYRKNTFNPHPIDIGPGLIRQFSQCSRKQPGYGHSYIIWPLPFRHSPAGDGLSIRRRST